MRKEKLQTKTNKQQQQNPHKVYDCTIHQLATEKMQKISPESNAGCLALKKQTSVQSCREYKMYFQMIQMKGKQD